MIRWIAWSQIESLREHDPCVARQVSCHRFESLQWWPCVDVGSGRDVRPVSLQDLLSAYVGAPGSFANAPAEVHGQMLLVAAFLSLRTGFGVSIGEAAKAARAWLDRSMPRRVFDQAIEKFIASPMQVVDKVSNQVEGVAF